jgi:hypothetical protein
MFVAGAVGFFFCIVFIFFLYYRLQVNKLDYKAWDLKTVTIDDYSIELAIDDALFKEIDSTKLTDKRALTINSDMEDHMEKRYGGETFLRRLESHIT